MRRRIYLHLGQGKTGTSAVQEFFARHRTTLREAGVCYPAAPGAVRHLALSLYGRGDDAMRRAPEWRRGEFASPDDVRDAVERRLLAEIVGSGCPTVVLSDEALFRARPAVLAAACRVLERVADELVFVVYLRRQDEHVVSRYKQTMREGRTHLLAEFVARPVVPDAWRYDRTLDRLAAAFPDVRLTVRTYDRSRFDGRGVVGDFLDAVGIDPVVDPAACRIRVNTSLDAHTTEFLRRRNARLGRARQPLLARLTELSDGPDLGLTPQQHTDFWALFEPGNRRLVADYLPDAADVFLAPPRPVRAVAQHEITDDDLRRVADRLAAARRARRASRRESRLCPR